MKLVRDSDGSGGIDGVPHILPHVIVTAIALTIVVIIFKNVYATMLASWIVLGCMFIFWFVSEMYQEHKMIKDGRHLKEKYNPFKWSQNRWQDILIPCGVGLIISICLGLWWIL